MRFQHTAARRRLDGCCTILKMLHMFQHTAARRRLAHDKYVGGSAFKVSTHSRPKAAGPNKRPPKTTDAFQHTAARRRLAIKSNRHAADLLVSTHSRPKAAGWPPASTPTRRPSFNTQPPEGGWIGRFRHSAGRRRFNTQPPEGGWRVHCFG